MSMEADAEASSFESSEMLAFLLGSTPLLSESWRICELANRASPGSFLIEQIGPIGYVAFTGVQPLTGVDFGSFRCLVPLDEGLFAPLLNRVGDEQEPVMVQAGVLHIFMNLYTCPDFQTKTLSMMELSKSIVVTGYSMGGAVASITALWLLSYIQATSSPLNLLCLTFGSPLLGNPALSRTVLRERFSGNFCHVIANHDLIPRLLFTPETHRPFLSQFWHVLTTSIHLGRLVPGQLPERDSTELFRSVVSYSEPPSKSRAACSLWPFGNFLFCSPDGAICLDNAASVASFLHLTIAMGSASSSIEDHLRYGEYVERVSMQFFKRTPDISNAYVGLPSYEAGLELAIESSGVAKQDSLKCPSKDCLKMAKRQAPFLCSANLAIELSKVTPYRAQIEWYKKSCDDSEDQLGYYDSFKQRGASKKHFKVNMNRIKLGQFWDRVIRMLDMDELPRDFSKRAKWVNASQFYKLLVEPLDIAEYYRNGTHRTKGHYIGHGRERRFGIFDRWWREREGGSDGKASGSHRSNYASLTQDSCFWARVEEATEWLERVGREFDAVKSTELWERIEGFRRYTGSLVEAKEVSKDVLAINSSYTLWLVECMDLKSRLGRIP